jgi:hypothetical protein
MTGKMRGKTFTNPFELRLTILVNVSQLLSSSGTSGVVVEAKEFRLHFRGEDPGFSAHRQGLLTSSILLIYTASRDLLRYDYIIFILMLYLNN